MSPALAKFRIFSDEHNRRPPAPATAPRTGAPWSVAARTLTLGRAVGQWVIGKRPPGGAAWRQVAGGARPLLDQAARRLEEVFLQVSDQFEPLAEESRRFLADCSSLRSLVNGGESGSDQVHETLALLQGPLSYIEECVHQHDQLVEILAGTERRTSAMLAICTDIRMTLSQLPYVSVLFRIESVRLPIDLRETFITITKRIEAMRTLVEDSIGRNRGLLEQANLTLGQLRLGLTKEFRSVATAVTEKRQRVDEAIRLLDARMAAKAAQDQALHQFSQTVGREIGVMVQSLQFQDIVQQKCSHVSAALADSGEDPATLALLQANQLDGVVHDLDQGYRTLDRSLAALQARSDEQQSGTTASGGADGEAATVDGIVELVLTTVGNVRSITQLVSDLTARAYEAVGPMEGLAQNLTSALSELSIDMRLVALNAQIRSVLDGTGTGLSQLSAYTTEISTMVDQLSHANSENLGQLAEGIQRMLGVFGSLRDRGRSELEQFSTASAASEARLRELRSQTHTVFSTIATAVARLGERNRAIRQTLERLPAERDQIAKVADQLRAYHTDQPPAPLGLRSLAAPATRYTMASERTIHDQVVCRTHPEAPATGAAEGAEPVPAEPAAMAAGHAELF